MAQNKSSLFDQDDIQLAATAKALAHPARIKILKILLDSNVCMCGEIVELLPLAQATVSQHLKELKQAGLIQGQIEGPKICYCLNPDVIKKVMDHFTQLFIKIQKGQNYDESCKT